MIEYEGETFRIRVEQDEDASNPREDWDMLTGFVTIYGRGDSRRGDVEAVHEDEMGLSDAHYRLRDEHEVERWARIFHGETVAYDDRLGGYWFVDREGMAANWPELAPGTVEYLRKQGEVIAGERDSYLRWVNAEVYVVILERPETRFSLTTTDTTVTLEEGVDWESGTTEWVHEDSLGGCYLDGDDNAVTVALECFSLSDVEAAELQDEVNR